MATKEEMKVTQAGEGADTALTPELKAQIMSELKEELKKEVRAEMEAEAQKAKDAEKPYKETEEEIAKANELVTLKLFKDKDRYKDDVLVIVNGESWLIKRGVTVQVPRKVVDALQLADDQTSAAADIISDYEEHYEAKKGQLT